MIRTRAKVFCVAFENDKYFCLGLLAWLIRAHSHLVWILDIDDSNIIIHIYMSCENGDISIHFCSYGYRHTSENKQTLNCFSSIRLTWCGYTTCRPLWWRRRCRWGTWGTAGRGGLQGQTPDEETDHSCTIITIQYLPLQDNVTLRKSNCSGFMPYRNAQLVEMLHDS